MGINLIQTGRFNRLFQKFFSIKGGANVTEVGAEILPVFGIPFGVEHRYLEGWNRFGLEQTVAAVAANNSVVRLRNPAGSNVIVVVEKIAFTATVASDCRVEIRAVNTDLATPGVTTNSRFDARGLPTSSAILSTQNSAAFSLTVINFIALFSTGVIDVILGEHQEITVLPGDSLTLLQNTVNTALNVSFFWRERAAEESERT